MFTGCGSGDGGEILDGIIRGRHIRRVIFEDHLKEVWE